MDKINVPQWNHFPFLGYLHYKNRLTTKISDNNNSIYLPALNPYLGFINHSIKLEPVTRDMGTQTEPNLAMMLGQQIIDKMGYE